MESPTPPPETATTRLARIWADQMPITVPLGVRIETLDRASLAVSMPMAPNLNHTGTVFGGSLSALATLTGWSAVWVLLEEAGVLVDLVIQDATIRYTHPARTDVVARVEWPGPNEVDRLLRTLAKRGRARIGAAVTVHDAAGEQVAEFEGRYVAQEREVRIEK